MSAVKAATSEILNFGTSWLGTPSHPKYRPGLRRKEKTLSGFLSLFRNPASWVRSQVVLLVTDLVVFLLQCTTRVQATQTGPAAAPRPLLSPAQASWKLLLLPPRPKAPPLKTALHQPNRSAGNHSDLKTSSHLTSAVWVIFGRFLTFDFYSQIFQGNRRTFQGQGYHSGGQRYNGGSYHDRNANRANHRYQSDGGSSGPTSHHSNNSRGPSRSSTSSYNQERPSHNGLPQRPPRTHCPWHWKPRTQSTPPTNPCTPLPIPSTLSLLLTPLNEE